MTSSSSASSPIASWLNEYNICWTTPSVDARGSMPLGNGDVGISAWVESNGDLQFYISRSDSYSEVSRLLKVGLVRVRLSPSPFQTGLPFLQRLRLHDGVIEITAGAQGAECRLKLFVDSENPVVHCIGRGDAPVSVTAHVESWREQPRTLSEADLESAWTMRGAPYPLVESADHFCTVGAVGIAWYHRNETSCVSATISLQGLSSAEHVVRDPLKDRTFGGLLSGADFIAVDERTIAQQRPLKEFALRVAAPCAQTGVAQDWLRLATDASAASAESRAVLDRTRSWWHGFWDRSWVKVSGNENTTPITRGYLLQRFMQAGGGRGAFPIKYNGGQFTAPPDGTQDNSDWRRWGDCHWWQNVRLIYYPMLGQGDFEMMQPFFGMYENAAPLANIRTKLAESALGVYYPETMTVWGTYANSDYGWERGGHGTYEVLNPWWSKTRNQGPELAAMMMDYWEYTQDEAFLRERVLPMAVSVLTYFDTRYPRDAAGRIVIDPTQALETYWTAVDDTPTIAGLRNLCERLAALPPALTNQTQRDLFARMLASCPPVPLETRPSEEAHGEVIAPARIYDPQRRNVENPETYPIWPFRLYGVGKPNLVMARKTFALRGNRLPVGWGYDGNCAAMLGLAGEAADILRQQCANSNLEYRWPATWGPNFDWLPDQNHGGNLLETAQLMLLQCHGPKILLFPAWPREWDVDFKLHATHNTTVEATLRDGEIVRLVVTPERRLEDLVNLFNPEPSLMTMSISPT